MARIARWMNLHEVVVRRHLRRIERTKGQSKSATRAKRQRSVRVARLSQVFNV